MADAPSGFVMDRGLQRDLLERMREVYPKGVEWMYVRPEPDISVRRQLLYLEEYGLCSSGISYTGPSWGFTREGGKITAAGLDFLEQDGGLGAILNVVTVKLHAVTIRDMLAAKMDGSDLPVEKKSALKVALGKLSGSAMTAATGDLVKMGLEHGPDAVHWIERLVSSIS